jgi:hypothetical protein
MYPRTLLPELFLLVSAVQYRGVPCWKINIPNHEEPTKIFEGFDTDTNQQTRIGGWHIRISIWGFDVDIGA